MNTINFEISFPRMPLWKGVKKTPVLPEFFPFHLTWHQDGYICQSTPQEVQKQVIASYADEQYNFPSTPPGFSKWGNLRGDIAISFIRKNLKNLKGSQILDIGGGTTYIAEKLTGEDGVGSYTIMDPSARQSPSSDRIKIQRRYFTSGNCEGIGEFDYVISMNCLEHVADPFDFLKGIKKILTRKKGRAILIFPDTEGQLTHGDFNVILHEHTNYLTKWSFENLAAASGLKVIHSESSYDLFYYCLESGEEAQGPHQDSAHSLVTLADKFFQNIKYFNTLCESLASSNQQVAFHGACNGLNNMLAFSNFFNEDFLNNILIFDGDELKAGKYLSICQNSILHSSRPEYKKVDHVIIAAMTFYEPIKQFLVSKCDMSPERIHPLYAIVT